ncbi:unnamed protein product, partial [Scytosiphon promiscuus]
MKQLTNNPKPDSTAKGWQVMCMGCSTFLPSMDFENYLLNFILEKCQIEGAEVRFFFFFACYAKYCLHTLEGMMSSRTNEGIVPTLEEIQAYKERPPILATIELVNGALLTEDLPVAPDLNVKKVIVLEICAHFGGLQAARTEMMGLFVYDLGPIDEEKGPHCGRFSVERPRDVNQKMTLSLFKLDLSPPPPITLFPPGVEQPSSLHAVAPAERGLHGRRVYPQGQAKTRLQVRLQEEDLPTLAPVA